ncbi:MAG: cytidylate kinase family protein [Treponemataceae bacterium]
MAIITISRKVASLGDETATLLAKLLGYTFVTRQMVEQKLRDKGVPDNALKKYDERKPNFWASLSRERDFYLDLLREIIYEEAQNDNRIFIGRGGFAILNKIPGTYFVRLVASDKVRLERLKKEFNWNEEQARQRLNESDQNREGFHKCFFNVEIENPAIFNLVLRTDTITAETAAEIIKTAFEKTITPDLSAQTKKAISQKLIGQRIVNSIAFEHKLQIYFLDAQVSDKAVVLHGISESAKNTEKAIQIAKELAGDLPVESKITFVSSYKASVGHLKK